MSAKCLNCPAENLRDYPVCANCESSCCFTDRADCRCNNCSIVYELRPGLKRCEHLMRYTGNQCQLADGHGGRHAWEPAWVERVAAIERQALAEAAWNEEGQYIYGWAFQTAA